MRIALALIWYSPASRRSGSVYNRQWESSPVWNVKAMDAPCVEQ